MKKSVSRIVVAGLIFMGAFSLLTEPAFPHGDFALPRLSPPEEYGDVLMRGSSAKIKEVTPVVFSHWVHRAKYTCRVCHGELDFSMKADDTGVVCDNGKAKNRYCTVCHNGRIAFAAKDEEGDNCKLCHNADQSPNREKFSALQKNLPRARFGNEIDWGKALENESIKPKNSLSGSSQPLGLDKTLTLTADMSGIPPAVFPHKSHVQWLDCANCHPDIFNIKKKTTKHFSMSRILAGEFCGVCHLRIAFPLNECKKCHPAMRN